MNKTELQERTRRFASAVVRFVSSVQAHGAGCARPPVVCCAFSAQKANWPDAHATFRGNREVTCQPIGVLPQNGPQYMYAIGWAFVMEPKQHHTMMRPAATKDEFAKILVVGNQDSPVIGSPGQDIPVLSLRHCFGNGKHIMANAALVFHYRCAGGLVYNETHENPVYAGTASGKTSSLAST